MMYGYDAWWMIFMPLLWVALIAIIVWAAVRLIRPEGVRSWPVQPRQETPAEILDRRYAQGEIDDEAYTRARARLSGREAGAS